MPAPLEVVEEQVARLDLAERDGGGLGVLDRRPSATGTPAALQASMVSPEQSRPLELAPPHR